MLDFYTTILSTQFTIFGIFAAVLFFYAQSLPPRLTGIFVKNFWVYLIISIQFLGLLMSSIAVYHFAFIGHDIFPRHNFCISHCVENNIFPLIELAITFIIFIIVIYLFWKLAGLVNAKQVIKILFERIDPVATRDFSYIQFKVEPPNTYTDFIFPLIKVDTDKASNSMDITIRSKIDSLNAEKIKAIQNTFNDYLISLKEKDSEGRLDDPFDDLFLASDEAIRDNDVLIWKFFNSQIVDLFKRWERQGLFDKTHKINNPFAMSHTALEYILRNLIFHLTSSSSLIISTNQKPWHIYLVDTLKELFKIIPIQHHSCGFQLIEFMNKLLQESLDGKDMAISEHIFKSFGDMSELAINENDNIEFDELMRSLGKYGEYLVLDVVFKEEPIMGSYRISRQTEKVTYILSDINEKLIKCDYKIYPLILVDAVQSIAEKLSLKASDKMQFVDEFIILLRILSDMAKKAIKIGNNDLLQLATHRLIQLYPQTVKSWDNEIPDDIIHWLVEIGATAAGKNAPVKSSLMWQGNPDKDDRVGIIVSALKSIRLRPSINSAMMDINVHSSEYGKHEEVWAFITRVGKALQTNFGFMFDCNTGDIYPQDDPRRR